MEMGRVGDGKNVISTSNLSLSLSIKFISISIRVPNQTRIKRVEMGWDG